MSNAKLTYLDELDCVGVDRKCLPRTRFEDGALEVWRNPYRHVIEDKAGTSNASRSSIPSSVLVSQLSWYFEFILALEY